MGNQDLLAKPLTETQIFRFYLMCKVHVEAALRALGGARPDPDVQMLGV